jgi:membrane protease YdiL (CAAX protease family)
MTEIAGSPERESPVGVVAPAVLVGLLVLLVGTIPRNLLFAANLRYFTAVPWAIPVIALYLWPFWRYLQGTGPPPSTAAERRASLRANPLPAVVWAWSLSAGGLGIVALVLGLRVANRMAALPLQPPPDFSRVSELTAFSLLLAAAPVAGVVEEAAFRGYMQGPIERRYGPALAVLVTGTMFAVAHLDFTLVLWPYYMAVAAIYGSVTYLTNSILPAVVLHTGGNVYSNLDLWLRGRAEWQASSGPGSLIWSTGADKSFWWTVVALGGAVAVMLGAYRELARAMRSREGRGLRRD